MFRLLITFVALQVVASSSFKRYKDYREYLAEWKAIVPQKYVHDVSHLASVDEMCYGSKCQFYYFQSPDLQEAQQDDKMTILMVSGMHGDEFIGPHTLLYAYPHLRAHKIIYFPMANPSGFIKGTRQTFPGKVDLNRDFPIDGNTLCYRTASTRILDFLFRTYRFDLTLALHNGGSGSEIGFNWGTFAHQAQSHTAEYDIYRDIGQMLKREGGKSQSLGLPEFQLGTMVQVVYAAQGTFDDWAYAVGKFPQIITKCSNYNYEPYPKDMTNSLVFLLELGPKMTTQLGSEQGVGLLPSSSSKNNGFIARAIRMLKALMNVLHPKIRFLHDKETLKISLVGCKQAKITDLIISKQSNITWKQVFSLTSPVNIQGDLRSNLPIQSEIQLQIPVVSGQIMKYEGSFECDAEWIGKGTTVFSKPRVFSFNITHPAQTASAFQAKQPSQPSQPSIKNKIVSNFDSLSLSIDLKEYTYQLAIFALLVFGTLVYALCKRCCKKKKVQKFEEVQFHPQSEQNTVQNEQDAGGDLHTARGGIIQM